MNSLSSILVSNYSKLLLKTSFKLLSFIYDISNSLFGLFLIYNYCIYFYSIEKLRVYKFSKLFNLSVLTGRTIIGIPVTTEVERFGSSLYVFIYYGSLPLF